nr:uncharacterized protein C3orf22 homolog [Meriones unguiculatus]
MDLKGSKKTCCSKKYTAKLQMRFAKRFPYRLCWLTEPTTVPPLSWKVKRNSLKDQLPLQKKLLPTRSIPIPGAVSPDFTWPFTYSPPSRPPPRRNSWEHKLVSLRFPKQDLHKQPPPQSPDNQPKQPPPQYADNQFLTCRELQPSGHVS